MSIYRVYVEGHINLRVTVEVEGTLEQALVKAKGMSTPELLERIDDDLSDSKDQKPEIIGIIKDQKIA